MRRYRLTSFLFCFALLHTHRYVLPGDMMHRYEPAVLVRDTSEPIEVDFPTIDFASPKYRWHGVVMPETAPELTP